MSSSSFSAEATLSSLALRIADGSLRPTAFINEKAIHRSLKNDPAIQQFTTKIRDIRTAASQLGLSDKLPGREHLTPAQHAAKEKAARDRTQKFLPIQQALAEKMGVFTARFIFSNTLVNELVTGKILLGGLKAYRATLIRGFARELGIDLGDYE